MAVYMPFFEKSSKVFVIGFTVVMTVLVVVFLFEPVSRKFPNVSGKLLNSNEVHVWDCHKFCQLSSCHEHYGNNTTELVRCYISISRCNCGWENDSEYYEQSKPFWKRDPQRWFIFGGYVLFCALCFGILKLYESRQVFPQNDIILSEIQVSPKDTTSSDKTDLPPEYLPPPAYNECFTKNP